MISSPVTTRIRAPSRVLSVQTCSGDESENVVPAPTRGGEGGATGGADAIGAGAGAETGPDEALEAPADGWDAGGWAMEVGTGTDTRATASPTGTRPGGRVVRVVETARGACGAAAWGAGGCDICRPAGCAERTTGAVSCTVGAPATPPLAGASFNRDRFAGAGGNARFRVESGFCPGMKPRTVCWTVYWKDGTKKYANARAAASPSATV